MRQLLLDLRRVDPEEHSLKLREHLGSPAVEQVVVIRAHRPLDEVLAQLGEGWVHYPLVEGPSAFYQAVCTPGHSSAGLDPYRREHRQLLELYPRMVASALDGHADPEPFTQLLESHLRREEEHLFGRVEEWTGEPRLARELGYDHQGLRAGLLKLPDYLERVAAGDTTKKMRDAFEIEFFHLFEHHYEREERGLYPLLERLAAARGYEF